ncbi:MAG TPA: aspartate kinase, partial [Vicinamibacteria bacterium]
MKFGGTSVGSAERMKGVAARVRERLAERPVVVVSALGGVTDLLIRGARFALHRDPASEKVLRDLVVRHQEVLRDLVTAGDVRNRLLAHLDAVAGELKILYTGVHYLEELTPRSLDAISAIGERLSCEIAAAALEQAGLPTRAIDARAVLVTDDGFGRALPLMEDTGRKVRDTVLPLLEGGVVPVIGGFIGATRDGVTTTLGRGGSDWSASILGALLNVREIQIWTDVDGMMTIDPRTVPAARVIPEVSFDEAAELAYFGAKVLHPASIR